MITIHIVKLEGGWAKSLPQADKLARHVIRAAAKKIRLKKADVTVVLADDQSIRHMNKTFRKKDKPTNVLSFPSPALLSQKGILGDVVVSLSTLKKEAKAERKTLEAHFVHLIVHGFLHLNGYDHMSDQEAIEMERKEVLILDALGYKNPYEERE